MLAKHVDLINEAKIKNNFVSPYPIDPVKIGWLKFFYWKFAVIFLSLVSLKIPYLRFVLPKDRHFRITEDIFVVKKKSLPTNVLTHFQDCGSVKGKQKYFSLWPDGDMLCSAVKSYLPWFFYFTFRILRNVNSVTTGRTDPCWSKDNQILRNATKIGVVGIYVITCGLLQWTL